MHEVNKGEGAAVKYRRSFCLQGSTELCFLPSPGSWAKFLQRQAECLSVPLLKEQKGLDAGAPRSTEGVPMCSVTKYPKLQAELLGGNCCLYFLPRVGQENLETRTQVTMGGSTCSQPRTWHMEPAVCT